MAGGILGAIGGPLVGGLMNMLTGGGRPHQSAEQQAQYALQNRIAQQLFSQSQQAPMSQPGEMQGLAQDRGILGQQQRNQMAGAFTQMAPNQPGFLNDFLRNVSAQQTGQQMMLDEQHMMDALSRRREALLQAANVGRNAADMAAPATPGSNLPQLMGSLAQAIAYRKHVRNGGDPAAAPAPAATTTSVVQQTDTAPGSVAPTFNETSGNPPDANVPATAALPPLVPSFNDTFNQPANPVTDTKDTSGAGDDPLSTAILALLKAHGYTVTKKGTKAKKKNVGDSQTDAMMAMMGQGQAPATGAMMGGQPGMQGSGAPGNEPLGGVNGIANQIRQSGGYGYRTMRGPSGQIFSY